MPRSRLPIPWTHVALYAALLAAGEVICLIPNALGESLLYNERIR